MLKRILQFSLNNRLVVILVSLLIMIAGVIISIRMEVDVFPDLTAPTVVVMTEAHGMAPEEVERLITFPIETSVNGASNVRRVRSSSSAGFSIVWVEFDWGIDIYRARQVVNEKITTAASRLPQGAGIPTMAPNSSIMGEIMLISVTADSTSMMELRTIADWNIRPALLATGGVSQVMVIGGENKQYQILASPQKMKYYNVTLQELLKAGEETNQNASGSFLNEFGSEYIIRGIGRTNNLMELGKTVIKQEHGMPIKIEDVAEIKIGGALKIGDGSLNGKPAVILTVLKQPGINTVNLTDKIENTVSALGKNIPADVKINTKVYQQSDFIKASIGNIQETLLEGSAFVIIILFIFLMNWQATTISLLALPISLLISILTLKWLGFTINTMSLGGMAIAIGSLVDDAIIDVENVFKRLRENAQKSPDQQEASLKVIFDASVEIRSSIINATIIIIVAFIPLFFLTGMEGRLLAPLGIAFIVSLFASLMVAITLTPVLCSFLLTGDKLMKKGNHESWLVTKLKRIYEKELLWGLQYKKQLLGVTIVVLLLSVVLVFRQGRSFLPEFNEGSLVISAVSVPGISLDESNKIGALVEKTLLTIPEVKFTTRRTGRAELDEHAQGVNGAEIDVPFVLKKRSREEFMKEVRQKLSVIPGVNITIGQPLGHRIDHMLSGTRANIAIKIFGPNLNKLYDISSQVKEVIKDIPGLVDVTMEPLIEIPQVQIKARRDMLAKYGITIGEFAKFVDVAFAGEKVSDVYEGTKSFDLILKFDENNRGKIDNIRNTLINSTDGKSIPLYYVAEIISTTGPNTINRENVQRKTVVSSNIAGRDQKSAVEEIKQKIEAFIKLPEGYRIVYGGQFEAEGEASQTLFITSLLSLLVIFLLLYFEFKKMSTTVIILINLPLALIGGIVSIQLTSGIISIPAIIGFITLFGIATRNGILLISHYNHLINEGKSVHETIIEGSKDRLSPILMTALTAGLALIPLAIGGDLPGNEIQSPMAKVILGGLLSSTFMNLIIVPIVFLISNQKIPKNSDRFDNI